MRSPRWTRARRALATLPAIALTAAGLSGAGALTPTTVEGNGHPANWEPGPAANYTNYAAPKIDVPDDKSEKVGGAKTAALKKAYSFDRKHKGGNPVRGRALAHREKKALDTGKNPADWLFKQADQTREGKLLTIPVEFNPNANDDFSDVMVPNKVIGEDKKCVPGRMTNGPQHNQIPNPAKAPGKDNNTLWIPDFSEDYYESILYSEDGYTERVRKDLTGPDGKPGFDISGSSLRTMYEEMSKGAYTVTGDAVDWIEVPHSEGWYGASVCHKNDQGEWVPPRPQAMNGHPDNPNGAAQLTIDAVEQLAKKRPDFPWADYDKEDPSDADNDGNRFEPDGVIDHLVLVHAGVDKSDLGGKQGTYSIWAHSSTVTGGATIPGTDLQVANYIVQGENSGVGVFAHEYGHDLGLPDLYDTSGEGDSDIAFWSLMASGSHSGPIFQTMPTHMDIWSKWVMGWADPKVVNPGDRAQPVVVGQSSKTPKFTADGALVNLPDKTIKLADPHSGEKMWWSNDDQSWADVRTAHEFQLPQGSDIRFWMWNNYVIEQNWDFGFVEVSTDGGKTWNELKVRNEAGELISTGDDYQDPNGRMVDFGNKKYGLTGSTNGWKHHYVDLSQYAGQTVQVRLRYATDAAFVTRGWFADDFSLTADGETVFSDDVESGMAGWEQTATTFTNTTGEGWVIDSGTHINRQFYIAEWRNFAGFDKGLKHTYDTSYNRDGSWNVEKIKYNAPGMMVYYRDASYGRTNHVVTNRFDMPSIGSKGGLLAVDSHYEPLRREGKAAEIDQTALNNLPQRPQTSNSAFTKHPTYPFKECIENPAEPFSKYCTEFGTQSGVSTFTDTKTWYPGLEVREDGLYFRDIDASVVVPSQGHQQYSTRVVNPDGSPATEMYGQKIAGHVLGSGNPADAGVAYGTKLRVITSAWENRVGVLWVQPPSVD